MSQPPAYSRSFSFTNWQAQFPSLSLPGSSVDLELNSAKATLDAVLTNLALIQRDDGQIKNASVGLDQLKAEVPLGFNAPSVWVTGTAYTANSSTVFNGSGFYRALTTHTSGVFATDLAALKWQLIVNLAAVPLVAANQIAVTPSGLLTTDVQTSLQALDSGKAALSHTQLSSTISDSTAAGRAMLVAANVAAQQALLGLGALAFLNSSPINNVAANLAFTGSIVGSLIANTNDWTPTGWATAAVVKLTASSAINITGFAATSDGDIKFIQNTGSNAVTILFESTSSSAVNRITGPAWPLSFVLVPGSAATFQYDATAARWRLLSPIVQSPTLAVAGGYRALICGNVAGNGFTAPGSPNTSFKIQCDATSLEDTSGNMVRLNAVSVTVATGTTGANGFDGTGSLVSAPLFAWVIYNPATATTAGLLSRSATAPTMPSGYTFKWRCGATFTDGSSNLLRTIQCGNRARYSTSAANLPTIVTGNIGSTYTSVSVSNFVPSTAISILVSTWTQSNGVGPSWLGIAGYQAGTAPSTQPYPEWETEANGAFVAMAGNTAEIILLSTNIFTSSSGMTTANVAAAGWIDNL